MRRERLWRSWTALVAAMVLGGIALEASAQPTREGLVADFQAVQRAAVEAAVHVYGVQTAAATAALDQALATLEAGGGSVDARSARAIGVKLGALRSGLRKTRGKILGARRMIAKRGKISTKLRKLRLVSRAAYSAGYRVGPPVVAELDTSDGGFHDPGEVVELQAYDADGNPCLEVPQVVVENTPPTQAIDLGSVVADGSGRVTLVMGQQQGSGSVAVTACGRSTTVLLYNYGPPPPPGLPRGFPTNLPPGLYQLSFSARGTGISIPTTVFGTIELEDLGTFAASINDAFQQVAVSIVIPGCSEHVKYTSYDGEGFSISVKIGCSLPGVSVNVSVSVRVERVS
jgi:hypothetical protein